MPPPDRRDNTEVAVATHSCRRSSRSCSIIECTYLECALDAGEKREKGGRIEDCQCACEGCSARWVSVRATVSM